MNTSDAKLCALLAFGQAALGLGLGLLLADRFGRQGRTITAVAALAAGLACSVPALAEATAKQIGESSHGAKRRLRSIRDDAGFPEGAEVY